MSIVIRSNADAFAARWQRAPRVLADLAEKNVRSLGIVLAAKMRKVLEPVKYTGALERSVSTAYEFSQTKFRVEVGPTAKHAEIVRTGTRPHWAPIDPLKKWARWKLGNEKAAYAVQRSIARYGTSRWLARRGIPGAVQTANGIGLDFPGQTLKRGDVQQGFQRTADRIGYDFKVEMQSR